MKNHELLELIGEVNEDYVQAADSDVVRPRFHWGALAACAALALAVWPVYRAFNPPLHDYTLESANAFTAYSGLFDSVKAPAGGASGDSAPDAPAAAPKAAGGTEEAADMDPGVGSGSSEDVNTAGRAPVHGNEGGYSTQDSGGLLYSAPTQDAPVQENAAAQYDRFWENVAAAEYPEYPEWCGGVWLGDERLTVAIADGFRTPELEARIVEGCGGEVTFQDVKYSFAHLDGLMRQASQVLDADGWDASCSIGVDVMENCLGVDVYSSEDIPKQILAALAALDPDGDAIRVRVFAGSLAVTDGQEGAEPAQYDILTGADG